MKAGSLFSGYGGLTRAVEEVFDAETVWHCEIEGAPSKVLAHRWPGVPNLGDITAVDWASVEPVDIIDGGSPCQDVSAAGKRAGMRAGTRSGLWAAMCDAIEIIRPSFVVWENVRGVLSAEADSALESCAGCVGDGDDGAVLRALGRVLGDLADLGYDARWHGLRAADIGAPHGRYRIFVVAHSTSNTRRIGNRDGELTADANSSSTIPRRTRANGWAGAVAADRWQPVATDAETIGCEGGGLAGRVASEQSGAGSDVCTSPDTARYGRNEGWTEPARLIGGSNAAERGAVATNPDRDGLARIGRQQPVKRDSDGCSGANVAWGQYEPAIRRWERVLGRPAPAPTELAPRGGQRLSPRFVEWMMGLPAGWVCDVPGLSRNELLKMLGNGVVTQQAVAALRRMLRSAAA